MCECVLLKINVSRADRFISVDLPKSVQNDDFTMEQRLLLKVH